MSNTLTAIMPKILARALSTLRQRVLMPQLITSDYSGVAAKKGDVVNVQIPVAQTASDVTPSVTPPTPADKTPTTIAIPLDKWKHTDFNLSDKEFGLIDADSSFIPAQMDEAIKALANAVNIDIFSKYIEGSFGAANFATLFGSGSVTAPSDPFASDISAATQARKQLNQFLCPLSDRVGMLNFGGEASALALAAFRDASQKGSDDTIREGTLGRLLGANWYADDHVPSHTAGTLSDGSGTPHKALTNGALSVGVQTMNIDSTTLTGTVVPGDMFMFAGQSQAYCVTNTSTLTAASNALNGITFYPPLITAVGDNIAVYFAPSHAVNLMFHRSAFAYATRPLADLTAGRELGNNMVTITDPVSKLTVRLEAMRQYKQTVFDLDILWGAKLLRPDLVARIGGAP